MSRTHGRLEFHVGQRLVFALVFLILSAGLGAGQGFTIEQIMSSPFPAGLVAAPNHGKLAWTQNAEGRRNIWVAIAPSYEARQITHYDVDDGQEITSLEFGPGSNHIVFVRGGPPNTSGEIPNPLSDPEGAERSIWIIEAAGGGLEKLADGSSPAIAPDGEQVAFLSKGQIWMVPAVEDGEPEQLAQTRGSARSLRWSPDGSHLAFVSNRGDHAFVGVFDFASKKITYLSPTTATDGNPVWSPDGRRIAFTRMRNERALLPFMPRREAIPWSIQMADVATGISRTVWTADQGMGSAFHGISASNQLFWGAGDVIVFPWEKTGWVHLYSVPVGGGSATALTRGEHEVEHVDLSPDGTELIYSSNQGDIDRRHLWRVGVASGPPVAITSGEGLEWSPVMAGDGGAIAYLGSDARMPASAFILEEGDARALAPQSIPADFPSDALVQPKQVVFSAADGMQIHAQLFEPGTPVTGARHPAVIFFHGGSRRQMLLGWHYMGYYHNAYALNQYLASRGYVVLSVNYRSGVGYGMEFREALHYGARGASEFNDVLGAGIYLRGRDDVDPNRIALWGGSYGGFLTALGLARASELFAAGVDIHGVHDWNVVIRNFVPDYRTANHAEAAKLAVESSPMSYVDDWSSPVLLIHGDDDRNVPFSESVDLAEALAKRHVELEELVFPDEVHGFLLHENWIAAFEAAADFLDRQLNPRETS